MNKLIRAILSTSLFIALLGGHAHNVEIKIKRQFTGSINILKPVYSENSEGKVDYSKIDYYEVDKTYRGFNAGEKYKMVQIAHGSYIQIINADPKSKVNDAPRGQFNKADIEVEMAALNGIYYKNRLKNTSHNRFIGPITHGRVITIDTDRYGTLISSSVALVSSIVVDEKVMANALAAAEQIPHPRPASPFHRSNC